MFGHGSSNCRVKTFCAICAGNHKTVDCKEATVKCANCNGAHKAMSPECPNRETFLKIRQRAQPRSVRQRGQQYKNTSNYNVNFPNTLNQSQNIRQNAYTFSNNQPSIEQNKNNLFSFEEMKNLTFELISGLKKCKSREDQFEVITSLACKFLYR